MTKSRRSENKISVYLETPVLEALAVYTAQANKSKSLVANDALKAALLSPQAKSGTDKLSEQLEILRDQLFKRDNANRKAIRLVQEMLGLFVRTYFNYLPELSESEKVSAAKTGRRRFSRFLGVVNDSLKPGMSILEQPIESHSVESLNQEVFDGES